MVQFAKTELSTERRSLTVLCQAGMSNRLRVLLSGKAVAEATQREFAMQWKAQPACGCEFAPLFQNDWKVTPDAAFDERRAIDLTHASWRNYPEFLDADEAALYVQNYGWIIQPMHKPRHLPLLVRCRELMGELEPAPAVTGRVREFQDAHFRPTMIGVHLRRGDMTHRRPDTTGNAAAAIQHVDAWLDEKSDAGILLCTDDGAVDPYSGRTMPQEDIRTQFVARYGTRVVFTAPSSLDRRTPEAIQDGLVDLWLLRATNYFVGTIGSSFSELAVFGRDVPFVQTMAGTARYEKWTRRLKHLGLYDRLRQVGHDEFGREVPYTMVVARFRIRLRVWLTGKI